MAQVRMKYNPDYAIMPGKSVQEAMESLGYTQKEFAERLDTTPQSLNRIFNEAQPITHEMACKLELVTGTSASYWNNREAIYRERIAKINEKKQLEKDLAWLKGMPIKDLQERGYVVESDDKVELLRSTLQFFGVSSVNAWRELWSKPDNIAAKRSACFETLIGPASAWIRCGEKEAEKISCGEYNKELFIASLKKIRALTCKVNFTEALIETQKLCAQAGVAFVLVKEIKKVPWSGATKWLKNKAMIVLSIRGKAEDHFWFTFFHEAGHVVNDNKKYLYINDNAKIKTDPREVKADTFAANMLIPKIYNSRILKAKSSADIMLIANEIEVAIGIVAGRYRKLTGKWKMYNEITRKLEWVS